jgi:polysaccharide deacetylase 2 family uncharacterized protein YibQ
LAIAALLVTQFLQSRLVDLRGMTADLGKSLELTFRNQGVPQAAIASGAKQLQRNHGAVYYYTRVDVHIPDSVHAQGLETVIERSLWRDRIVIAGVQSEGDTRVLRLKLGPADVGEVVLHGVTQQAFAPHDTVTREPLAFASRVTPASVSQVLAPAPELREWTPPMDEEPTLEPARTAVASRMARIAIILDDGGYGGPHTEIILGLDRALTLSILPYTPHGTELAERAAALGFEVMLHMPMENISATLRHEGQLNVGMTDGEIDRLTAAALAQVPHAVGINNHMGSKFTAETKAMEAFLGWVEAYGLYFVDSGTTADSVAYETAQGLGIRTAARTLFLDNDDDPEAIRTRILELIAMAQQQGEAIGIGHFRPNTAAVLAQLVPQLPTMGIELVPASALVR